MPSKERTFFTSAGSVEIAARRADAVRVERQTARCGRCLRRRRARCPFASCRRRAPRLPHRGRGTWQAASCRAPARADARRRDAGELLPVVGEFAREPRSSIRDGDDAPAVGIDGEAGPAAEERRRRCEHRAAAPFEAAEARRLLALLVEAGERARLDGDGLDLEPARFRLAFGERDAAGNRDGADEHRRLPLPAAGGPDEERDQLLSGAVSAQALDPRSLSAAAAPGLWVWLWTSARRPAFSSNNSTSLSVMAPASSLGSVIVTARR